MSVLEAMACGLPVVATPVGLARELASQPPSHSAEGLAQGVLAILDQPERLPALRRQARAVVEERYSLPGSIAAFCQLYEQARPPGQAR
jgi:glycosyltransferase involved in cell wall biosynthesis